MSKLALIRQYQYSPQAGGLFSFAAPLVKTVGGFIGKALNIGKKALPAIGAGAKAMAKNPALQALAGVVGYEAAVKILSGKGGGGSSGSFGYRRRARGITALELRGYRKVANLIHKEGMVSRRARGRKHA